MDKRVETYQQILVLLNSWRGVDTINAIMQAFPELGIYLAGGVVRDVVLGRDSAPADFDFFIEGKEVDLALAYLEKRGTLRRGPFGSPRWFPTKDEKVYCDFIPIKRFFNGLWQCEDIVDVLNQFDFTGNAVAVDLRTRQFYDPQNGYRDLLRQIMRAVRFDYPGEPIVSGQSITRPAVVWFRILHYATALNLTIEPVTMNWLKKHRRFLKQAPAFNETFFSLHPEALNSIGLDL
jgi:hypothetical protein